MNERRAMARPPAGRRKPKYAGPNGKAQLFRTYFAQVLALHGTFDLSWRQIEQKGEVHWSELGKQLLFAVRH